MADSNVDLVQREYELWNERDFDSAFAIFDTEVEVIGHPELPDPGPVRGREDVRDWVRGLLDAWEEVTVVPEQVLEAGDRVVVLFHLHGLGKGSGVEVTSGHDAHVWTLRDGKVVALRWYQGTTEALEETGLA